MNNETPIISIIVPIYKVEQYLRKCVDSILAQTYKNIEVILVDDGSPDGCPAICDEYSEKDSRVVVIHQKNAGVSAARNAGLDIAKGEYIGFVDSDDWIEPDMYEVLYYVITESEADIADISYRIDNIAPRKTDNYKYISFSPKETVRELLEGHLEYLFVWNKLFSKNSIKNIRFLSTFALWEDCLFAVECIVKCTAFVHVKYQAYHYIYRSDSACHSIQLFDYDYRFRKLMDVMDVFVNIIKAYDKSFTHSADMCVTQYLVNFSNEAILNGVFTKNAYECVFECIKKHTSGTIWKSMPLRKKCWICLFFFGRRPFIAVVKLYTALRRIKHKIYKLFKH